MLFIFSQHIYISFVHISIGTLVQDVNDCTDSEINRCRIRKCLELVRYPTLKTEEPFVCEYVSHNSCPFFTFLGLVRFRNEQMWELGRGAFWHMSTVLHVPAWAPYHLVCLHVLIFCACMCFYIVNVCCLATLEL